MSTHSIEFGTRPRGDDQRLDQVPRRGQWQLHHDLKGQTKERNLLLACGLFAPSALPVTACGPNNDELKLSLIGDWQVANGFGTPSINERSKPLPSGNNTRASFIPTETGLAVTGGVAPGPYEARFVEDARIVLDVPNRTIARAKGSLVRRHA
ncbi:hypothetical protein [Phaeobacter sp. S60]|uniref:hypothetical protein n=1 Tax=Phaeobacter sp. S60 TaxID=1569353 RepID=UPI00058E858E|nr:hypothetical protein [Phaeobacter sp. S60]KII15959.1 hypothetical protein OO25_08100 [Phaeobacter sp. S60]